MKRDVALALAAVAAFAAAPLALPSWAIFLLTLALAKAVVVLAIALLLRGGLVSFGHGMFFAVGAYAVGLTMKWLGLREALLLSLLGTLLAAAVAALLGLFIARYRGIFFGMLNMAISMVVYALLLKLYWLTGGTDGVGIRTPTILGVTPDRESLRVWIYGFSLALTLLAFGVVHRFWISPLGFMLRAVRDNEVRVEYTGVSVHRVIYTAYVLSGALAGLGGVLTGFSVGHIVPELAYWTTSGEFVFIAVLGGPGSIPGPLVGAIAFEFLKSYAYKYAAFTWQMTLGVTMLLIILFMPGGLWSIRGLVGRSGRPWRWSSRPSA
ncbi:MAG: branched-chain amino acid ABC transporter permease [Candidatus Rokubacteria bacterium]|nr:branched-chain amino acid ABC transporter permease [Candidatus Rokubacteria bacterium]